MINRFNSRTAWPKKILKPFLSLQTICFKVLGFGFLQQNGENTRILEFKKQVYLANEASDSYIFLSNEKAHRGSAYDVDYRNPKLCSI